MGLLTAQEEQALARRMHAGDMEARDELVARNMGLVHSIVKRYGSNDPATDYDDLVQEGVLGLMKALEKFDPDRGLKLSTVAVWWIRQRIQRTVKTAGAIRRDANPEVPRKTAWGQRAIALRQAPIMELDAPFGDSDRTLLDVVAGQEWGDPENEALNRVQASELLRAAKLSKKHGRILWRMMTGYTCHEAAEPEGLSRGMPNQILNKVRSVAQRKFVEEFMNKPCLVEGCQEPRMLTKSGRELTRCEDHQREYWREAAAAKAARQEKSENGVHPPVQQPVPEPAAAPAAGCTGDCVYRDVIEALAAKNPAVRDLVDAMQRVRDLREELKL